MEVLLEVADSLLTYRARYLSQLQVAPVVDLLLTDDSNPRSVVFQATELVRHVSQLPRLGRRDPQPRRAARDRAAEQPADAGRRARLQRDRATSCARRSEATAELFWQFSDDVEHTWFSHTSPSHTLAIPAWVDEELEVR